MMYVWGLVAGCPKDGADAPQFKFEVLVTNNGLLIVFWDKDLSLLYKWLLLKQLNTLINEENNPT
jgi:hypothetical protein